MSERRAAPAAGTAAARLTRALVWRAPASRDRGFRTVRPRRDGAAERRNDQRGDRLGGAEVERDMISESTREGLARSQVLGVEP